MSRMFTIFRIEWLKLQRPDMYIMSILYLALVVLFSTFVSGASISVNNEQVETLSTAMFFNISSAFGWIFMILTVILSISREYGNNAFRKRIVNGFTRDELYIAQFTNIKIIWLALVALWFLALIIYSLLSESNPIQVIQSQPIEKYISVLFGFLAYGIIAAFWISIVRKTVLSLVFYLCWNVVEKIIQGVSGMAEASGGYELDFIQYLLPGRVIESFTNDVMVFEQPWMMISLFCSILLFMLIPYLKIKTSDF